MDIHLQNAKSSPNLSWVRLPLSEVPHSGNTKIPFSAPFKQLVLGEKGPRLSSDGPVWAGCHYPMLRLSPDLDITHMTDGTSLAPGPQGHTTSKGETCPTWASAFRKAKAWAATAPLEPSSLSGNPGTHDLGAQWCHWPNCPAGVKGKWHRSSWETGHRQSKSTE